MNNVKGKALSFTFLPEEDRGRNEGITKMQKE